MQPELIWLILRRFVGKKRSALLKLFALVVVFILLGEVSLSASGTSASTNTPIKHIIILIMENHSFDNFFGQYGRTSSGEIAGGITIPYNLITHPVSQNLTAVSPDNFSTTDPYEGYSNYHQDWNNGQMNGFLNGSGPSSLYYFTADQMGLQWALAQNYAIGDMYFSSTLSETLPNRLISLAGYSPVKQDQFSPPPSIPYDKTIFSELNAYGVSWGYYFKNPSNGIYPLNFISGMNSRTSSIGTWTDLENEIRSGTLPDVTWVSSISGGESGYSQHPPDNVLVGEIWMFTIIEMLMESGLWKSSAIFVTYDEGGGYYDQVSPPSVGGSQLGFRVPFMVISPYAKEDYVSNTIMSHTSILGFIDYNWKMLPLNRLVSFSNLPLDMFNFNSTNPGGSKIRSPLVFNASFQRFAMQNIDFNQSFVEQFHDIGNLFPMDFQYNVSALNYSLQGSSNFNLSQVTHSLYVSGNQITSFPLNTIIYEAALVSIFIGIVIFIIKRLRKSKER